MIQKIYRWPKSLENFRSTVFIQVETVFIIKNKEILNYGEYCKDRSSYVYFLLICLPILVLWYFIP